MPNRWQKERSLSLSGPSGTERVSLLETREPLVERFIAAFESGLEDQRATEALVDLSMALDLTRQARRLA